MTFFVDLSPHTYTDTEGLPVLNVGWLDEGQPFSVGPTSREFQNALLELCSHAILLHRGVHSCWFCRDQRKPATGNGQVRVLSTKEMWYAAPTLVHHYVSSHGYSPPGEFVDAVLSPVAVGTDYARKAKVEAMIQEHRRSLISGGE